MPDPLPPGAWPSPLSAASVAAGGVALGAVAVTDGGRTAWWSESRPSEGGRTTVLRRTGDGPAVEVLPAELDARTRVHEYGGRCWLPLEDGGLVTSSQRDQRLWHVDGEATRALTPDTGAADRYGDPQLLPGGTHLLCVRERVGEQVRHALVAVPLDGSGDVVELWTGSDFVWGAAVSPDGDALAFLTWDHPRMPWDGTELRVAPLLDGPALGQDRVLLGGPEESVLAPSWDGDGAVRAGTDRSGWWNLVRVPAAGGEPEPLWPVQEDCGYPQWALGWQSHVPLPGGRVALLHSGRLAVLEPDGAAHDVDVPFDTWLPWLAADGDVVVGVAHTGVRRPAVVAVDTARGTWREVAGPEQPDPAWAPVPQRRSLPSPAGRTAHAVVYPPTSPHGAAARRCGAAGGAHGARRADRCGRRAVPPRDRLLHQPRLHRRRRRPHRLDRLRPRLPTGPARAVGRRRRRGLRGRSRAPWSRGHGVRGGRPGRQRRRLHRAGGA
jgi:hypothetical protein